MDDSYVGLYSDTFRTRFTTHLGESRDTLITIYAFSMQHDLFNCRDNATLKMVLNNTFTSISSSIQHIDNVSNHNEQISLTRLQSLVIESFIFKDKLNNLVFSDDTLTHLYIVHEMDEMLDDLNKSMLSLALLIINATV